MMLQIKRSFRMRRFTEVLIEKETEFSHGALASFVIGDSHNHAIAVPNRIRYHKKENRDCIPLGGKIHGQL